MTIKLQVDIDRVTLQQLIDLESAVKIVEIRDALAPFAVDENNQPLEIEQAKQLVGNMTIRQMREATDTLLKDMKDTSEKAVPPDNSGS